MKTQCQRVTGTDSPSPQGDAGDAITAINDGPVEVLCCVRPVTAMTSITIQPNHRQITLEDQRANERGE